MRNTYLGNGTEGLHEYKCLCTEHLRVYEGVALTDDTYLFRQENKDLPMLPDIFSNRFKKILKANGLPEKLNIHSLRHSVASVLIANGYELVKTAVQGYTCAVFIILKIYYYENKGD